MATLKLKNLEKSFGTTKVIKNLNLSINDGEFLVIVGPSGCGKSTLLRMIAGLEEITGGELFIGETLVNNLKPKDRDIAMVFQSYALYPHLTVFENMAFGLKLRKIKSEVINELVNDVSKILGLTELLNRYPRQLSGGQRQRVAMGRAIVRKPAVFLFDEPLSNLDAALRSQMRVELKKLHHKLKTTMIYVTHDQIEAMTLADRIIVLREGILQQAGTPYELFNVPANKFVAGFIGTPSMNFINGELIQNQNSTMQFVKNSISITINDNAMYKNLKPEKIWLGLRPTDISVVNKKSRFEAILDIKEPLGWETLLHLNAGDEQIVVMLESILANRYEPGQTLFLDFDDTKLHLFSGETGERLS